jgi:hypothetical protein
VDGLIAAQHQVVAVVDPSVQGLVVVGTASAPGLSRSFVDKDPATSLGEGNRTPQPGQAGADHVHRRRHAQVNP